MEIKFTTEYSAHALSAMARALRKTVRRKRSQKSRIFGFIVIILGVLLTLPFGNEEFSVTSREIITWIAVAAVVLVMLFEDKLNGFIAKKRLPPKTERSTAVFGEENYRSSTELGESVFTYDSVTAVAETKEYFVLIFGENHAQVYDKKSAEDGALEAFRALITEKTGKEITEV